jgi:hypothetical protein
MADNCDGAGTRPFAQNAKERGTPSQIHRSLEGPGHPPRVFIDWEFGCNIWSLNGQCRTPDEFPAKSESTDESQSVNP